MTGLDAARREIRLHFVQRARLSRGLAAFVLAVGVTFCALPVSAWAKKFTVTTTADSGPGSLRDAITSANAHPGRDHIDFHIGSGSQTIRPASGLPAITDPVVIDGTTQPGFTGTPLIDLNGANAGPNRRGLFITRGKSTVRGLEISGWTTGINSSAKGIELRGAGGNLVVGNLITDNGSSVKGSFSAGLMIDSGSSGNTIGGSDASDANDISGNRDKGVSIAGEGTRNNVVEGNRVTNNAQDGISIFGGASANQIGGAGGSSASPRKGSANDIHGNGGNGVSISNGGTSDNVVSGNQISANGVNGVAIGPHATSNQIGGDQRNSLANRNVISGNTVDGVAIGGMRTSGNAVLNNDIVENGKVGVVIRGGATSNTIGGTQPGGLDRNVISGNGTDGVVLGGSGTTSNVVEFNDIGTTRCVCTAEPNGSYGVVIQAGAGGNTVGGPASPAGAVPGNVISGNAHGGIYMSGRRTTGNLIEGNLIGLQGGGQDPLGNGGNGVTVVNGSSANTIGGTGAGDSNRIAYNHGDGVQVNGAMTIGNASLTNSIFANTGLGIALINGGNSDTPAPVVSTVTTSGNMTTIVGTTSVGNPRVEVFETSCADPEGEIFLGTATVTGSSWTLTAPKFPVGGGATATVTDTATGDTSQFSNCQAEVGS